jgi:hypothetical protein
VQRYLARTLEPGGLVPQQVRLTQVGEMCLRPGGRALRFSAVEELAVEEIAFSWRARIGIVPGVSLRVLDRYEAGEGLLEVRLWGLLPVTRARGADVSAGEALRYLAELPWVPHAMLANQQLEWRELDAQTVEVGTTVGATKVAMRLELDTAGDIVGASCDARPRIEGEKTVPTPWAGRFAEYAEVGGLRVPTQGEVRWELPDGPFTYWRGTITSLELDPPS